MITPRWLSRMRAAHGDSLSEQEALLLYRPALEWEEHSRLCKGRKLAAVLSYIAQEDHPTENEVLYISSFNMFDQYGHKDLALDLGYRFLVQFSEIVNQFSQCATPDEHVLKRMAILYDQAGQDEFAIWVCDVAAHYGITNDGTKRGFPGRREKLMERINRRTSL